MQVKSTSPQRVQDPMAGGAAKHDRRKAMDAPFAIDSNELMHGDHGKKPHVLLVTGRPGVGKTTVTRRLADLLGAERLRGFYTEEIREGMERRGFRLVGFDRTTRVIAHVDFPKSRRIGKHGVNVGAIDEAAALLQPDPTARVYLVDEIGRMECLSQRFVAGMRALLSANIPVVATVAARGGGFIAEIKRKPGCELWQVTHANRDELPSRIRDWIAARA